MKPSFSELKGLTDVKNRRFLKQKSDIYFSITCLSLNIFSYVFFLLKAEIMSQAMVPNTISKDNGKMIYECRGNHWSFFLILTLSDVLPSKK